MDPYISVKVDDQTLVSIEDPDFGLLDGIRIEKANGTTIVLRMTDDEALSALIATAVGLQGLRRMQRRSCGHPQCANSFGHIDSCRVDDMESQVR